MIKKQFVLLTVIFVAAVVSSCGKSTPHQVDTVSPFASFREIPGVTAEEINAIESFREKYSHFVYGVDHTTEAFPVHLGKDNEVGGYAARFCGWLSDLFEIPFIPKLYMDDWFNLLAEFENGDVHFMGDLMPTEERRGSHFMTGTISERFLTAFQIPGAPSINEIAKTRPPRLAFPREYVLHSHTIGITDYKFESVFVDSYAHAYSVISSGEADAFMTMHTAEPTLNRYGDVVGENFFPLVLASASLSTRADELWPVISVAQKALENGAMSHLTRLHTQGRYDFMRNELFKRLTVEEIDYIQSDPVVKVAAETANYPISFYNNNEDEFQGIAFDVMDELQLITGLSFAITDTQHMTFTTATELLEHGNVSMITELGVRGHSGHFLWSTTPIMRDHSVFISKSEFPDVYFNELGDVSVGMVRGTGRAALFNGWFPNNTSYKEYNNADSAFNALRRGEIDMLLTRANYLLALENYREIAGYRDNIVLDDYFNCSFGFNKNEELLCGIVDKALALIDIDAISGHWTNKRYDYRVKVVLTRLPWLISATILLFVTLALLSLLSYRNRNERKKLTELVKEKTSTLSAILDGTPDLIFGMDLSSRFTECNRSLEKYLNVRKSDILGKDLGILGGPVDLAAQFNERDNIVFNEKRVLISEEVIPSGDGTMFLFETIKSPLIQEDGKVTGLVGMARDITRRKAAEDEAKRASAEAMRAYAEAENASETKSHFIANMSHEMRTPMNVIVGLTDLMLEEEEVRDNIRDTFKKINIAGNTLMGLINDVLDISKVEAGKLDLMPVQYDVASLLNDIITLNTIRIEEKPIKFILDINEDLPQSLFGDDLRVKQVLNNLLSNAFKYTKEGSVTLGVSCHPADSASVWVSFYIRDTGIGIRGKDMTKLFTDYNQVDTQANRTIEGTGLGLSITKKFIELMDGKITVESDYGKGTAFYATIRQGFVTDQKITTETVENLKNLHYSEKKGHASERLVRSDLSYAKVLVVDDFPINLDVAAGMLRKYKMQVDCVLTGQEAVNLITAKEPVYDAIFMDHMMPEMDGIEATKLIRALGTKYSRDIPIIALTANAIVGNEQMFIKNGFNAYLPKPFNAASLDSIVQRWVRDKSRE
jgi:PAS domain S-box-containing protein